MIHTNVSRWSLKREFRLKFSLHRKNKSVVILFWIEDTKYIKYTITKNNSHYHFAFSFRPILCTRLTYAHSCSVFVLQFVYPQLICIVIESFWSLIRSISYTFSSSWCYHLSHEAVIECLYYLQASKNSIFLKYNTNWPTIFKVCLWNSVMHWQLAGPHSN